MLAKLQTSLLSPKHAAVLQLEPFTEGHNLVTPAYAGFKIPYFTLDGTVDTEFYRFRFTQIKPSSGFGAVTAAPEKPRRYGQPTGSSCGVYLPPLLQQSWRSIAEDPSVALIVTEGELKAACACSLGCPTIGLGGVFNWRSAKHQQELLPILEEFVWIDRIVNLCFDSDIAINPMVRMAASRLAALLSQRGAKVLWTEIPPAGIDNEKQGLDDYAYVEGPQALMDRLAEAKPLGAGTQLHELNCEVALIRSTGEIVELRTGVAYTAAMFSDVVFRHKHYTEWKDDGKSVTKYTAKEWLAWTLRNEVPRVEYDPACPNILTASGAYNSWHPLGWACEPSQDGNIALWEKLVDRLFASVTPEALRWVKQWFAWPLAHPGAKLHSALLLWGPQQGTGKTLLGETMSYIYGQNYGTVSNSQLASQFNEWAEGKQFIVGDEISMGDKRHIANELKDMITGQTLRLNTKNRKTYVVRNCINLYFTSNHQDAFYLEGDDRRIFVHKADGAPLTLDERNVYLKWLREDGGAARLFWYLSKELDLTGFDPHGRPPWTAAKGEMTATGRGDTEDWCVQVAQDPDSVISQPYDLFRTVDLLGMYDPDKRERTKSVGLGRALAAAGVFQVAGGNNSAKIEGMRTRFWAVRNAQLYKRIGPAAAARAYEKERSKTAPSNGKFATAAPRRVN